MNSYDDLKLVGGFFFILKPRNRLVAAFEGKIMSQGGIEFVTKGVSLWFHAAISRLLVIGWQWIFYSVNGIFYTLD